MKDKLIWIFIIKIFLIPKKYRADLLIDKKVLVDNKAIKALTEIDEARLIHYLKAPRTRVGLLLNFGSAKLEIKRRIY